MTMGEPSTDSTTRFSQRVDAYVKYRPDYPVELLNLLREKAGLHEGSIIADIGSGTGISAEMFVRNGLTLYGIEPNSAMREAAEKFLENYDCFHSIDATAEETTLADNSVDVIIAGQAFHWFDREGTKQEFQRILKPGGSIALFWNSRRTSGSPFLKAYEEMLLTYGTDYQSINHQNISDDNIKEFFAPNDVKKFHLYNEQVFNFDGVRGRLESSSYAPTSDHSDYKPMIGELHDIFNKHKEDDTVRFEYDLIIYIGQLSQG